MSAFDAIKALTSKIHKMFNDGNLDGIPATYTENAVIYMNEENPITGRQDHRRHQAIFVSLAWVKSGHQYFFGLNTFLGITSANLAASTNTDFSVSTLALSQMSSTERTEILDNLSSRIRQYS
ncbi:hypothetical protein LSH36_604g04090 [Paralvinella palmiformis]|uniref:Uncharacterized protein n=1 Tax=Paralvinella palmiformis TaxID=53620 RepID=A0AAD9J4G4_9ANNE|nr:hypothetical protein LSH36_604g04090 [Paralvinella palmiformis]